MPQIPRRYRRKVIMDLMNALWRLNLTSDLNRSLLNRGLTLIYVLKALASTVSVRILL